MYSLVGHYPSFLVFTALFLAVVFTIVFMPGFIRFLKREDVGQQVREEGLESHYKKQGTPTMGGVVMVVAVCLAVLIVGYLDLKIGSLLAVFVAGALIGTVDDYKKVHYKNTEGMSPKGKLILQFIVAGIFILVAVNELSIAPTLVFPLFGVLDCGVLSTTITIGGYTLVIPWIYLIFCLILLVGMCNAVNLTDGLDGLASGCVAMAMLIFAFIAYRLDTIEPAIFAAAICGACIAFLWFNSNPASIFMGDTGSLSFGMAVGALAIVTKTEVLSILIGGLFVAEALSVMLQVFWFKKKKKRLFLMAPLHHHFEKKGWGENKVVVRFWMISGILAAAGYALFFMSEVI